MSYNLHQAQSHEVLRSWQSQRTDVNHHKDFVLPMFIGNDDNSMEAIESMPEVYRYGCNKAIEYLEPLVYSFGLRAVLLFPVVTKTDQAKFNAINDDDYDIDDDNDDDGDSGRDIISSSVSSGSHSSSPSSSSADEEEITGRASVLPERLLPADESSPATSQNPFLNQNEEEEDHLLGEQGAQNEGIGVGPPLLAVPSPPSSSSPVQSLRKKSKSLDLKLIKGLALKDVHNPVLRLIPLLRAKFPELLIICDVCLCAFTSTGHCCLFDDHPTKQQQQQQQQQHLLINRGGINGAATNAMAIQRPNVLNHFPISNRITCQYLAMLAVEYALRGCNVIAPSDMMDGRILTIRERLDENKLHHVSIMSYSAKFASAFYGPFRQATDNAPEFGDRRAYQLPPGSRALAIKAVERDIKQGADFVMVKPGSSYLDIVRDIREAHPDVPIAIYQVSGEYAMLKVAAKANILNLKAAVNEMLTSYRRAGATIIISYFTPELLRGEL